MPVRPPFNDDHRRICRDGLRSCERARELIDKAKRCGINCDQREQIEEQLRESLEGYQREFMDPPPQPAA